MKSKILLSERLLEKIACFLEEMTYFEPINVEREIINFYSWIVKNAINDIGENVDVKNSLTQTFNVVEDVLCFVYFEIQSRRTKIRLEFAFSMTQTVEEIRKCVPIIKANTTVTRW